MGERPKTFQTRARRVKDDGDDFEDFVFECFRIAKEERGFTKRLARGRDGAIDLFDGLGEPGAATVAECKYIGSGKAADATGRWREVYANLRNNLTSLVAATNTNVKSPYRAWLDPKRPVTRYRFCVTATMSDAELKALEELIAGDFGKLVEAGVPQVRVLAEEVGAVRVLRWDWFHAELEEHPSLSFRWFLGLPPGVKLFSEQDAADVTFRDFLSGGQLRYFSRDQYARDGIGRVEHGEADLIAKLTGEDGAALLITGPGGVGKTRLSWELADKLSKQEYEFDVYRLGRSAGSNSVTQLAACYPGPASIVLLVDYAEAAPRLSEIADAIEHVASNGGHRLRLIATCRASAVNQVKDAISVLPFKEKSLGSVRTGENDYAQWVTRSILSLEPIPGSAAVERVCRAVPALAAFAIFLFRRHRGQFNAQFGALHGLDDFENWVSHRLAALTARFGGDVSIARSLARIALALPLAADAFESFEAENSLNRSLLRTLIDDCWIEREDGCYFAAHDVFADALVARWMLEADHAATERAIDLLHDATQQNRLAGALIVLDRLALHPRLIEIDGAAVADRLIARYPEQVLQCCGILLGGSLLSLEEKLDLLHRSEALREALNDPVYDVGLSFLAAEATRRRLSVAAVPALATLIELLDRASQNAHMSNMVLRRAYALDPDRFRVRTLANIGVFPRAEQTQFLLGQMLRSGEPAEYLREGVGFWLEGNANAFRASFVYTAWLNAKGAIDAVSEPLLSWVGTHGQTPEAQFVYAGWLNAKGPIDAVSEPLLSWVGTYGQIPEARFVYTAWLSANGPIDAISAPLLSWIGTYRQTPDASFVYTAWLNAKGSIDAVSEPLLSWVGTYGQTSEAQFVYAAWLNAKGPIDAVSEPLLSWVGTYGQIPEARFVYAAWLNAKGPIDAISKPLLSWVGIYGQIPEARFVYAAWLSANGPIDAISEPLLSWVGTYGQTPDASFFYVAWLDSKGPIDAVSEPLLSWVGTYGQTREAQFIYAAWLNAKGPIDAVSEPLLSWVGTYGQTPEAQFVYAAWLNAKGTIKAVSEPLLDWVAEHGTDLAASYLYRAWFNRAADIEALQYQIFAWLVRWHGEPDAAFVTRHLCKRHDLPENVILAIARWSATFADHDDSLDRLATLLAHAHADTLSDAGFLKLIAWTEDVVVARVSQGRLSEIDRSRTWAILASLATGALFLANPYGCLRSVAVAIRSDKIFSLGLDVNGADFLHRTYERMLNAAVLALRWGELSIDADAEALRNFVAWLRAAEPQMDGWERLLPISDTDVRSRW